MFYSPSFRSSTSRAPVLQSPGLNIGLAQTRLRVVKHHKRSSASGLDEPLATRHGRKEGRQQFKMLVEVELSNQHVEASKKLGGTQKT
jgi:hypothetical protein